MMQLSCYNYIVYEWQSVIANNKLILKKIKGEPLTRTDLSSATDQAKNIYPKGYEIIDKYIKQLQKGLSLIHICLFFQFFFGELCLEFFADGIESIHAFVLVLVSGSGNGISPVSYTHLDVYKRQLLYFSEIGFYMIFHNRVPLNVLTTNIR